MDRRERLCVCSERGKTLACAGLKLRLHSRIYRRQYAITLDIDYQPVLAVVVAVTSLLIRCEQIRKSSQVNQRFIAGLFDASPRISLARAALGSSISRHVRTSSLSADMEGPQDCSGVVGRGAHFAVASGIFATTGSLLGKLAGGADASSLLSLLLKGALLGLMITCNTVGCTFFVKALHSSGSSLPVTIASAATNYVCSALVGFVVFDESTSLTWWCGTSLVLLGLVLTCYAPDEKGTSADEKKLKQQ